MEEGDGELGTRWILGRWEDCKNSVGGVIVNLEV